MMAHHQKQNMRDHLLAVQQVVAGASVGDFVAVEKAASRLGYSERMGQMCTHMGAGAPGFTEAALSFHHAADGIAAAARQRSAEAVLASLSETLGHCTGCHERFQQRVVDERTWSSSVGGAAVPMPHPH
jgi:hypothetical protein